MSAIRITVLGDHHDEYSTHRELDAVLARLPEDVTAHWVASDAPEAAAVGDPAAADGVWIAPGGPYRDDDAVLAAIGRAREAGVPLLGTCSGFQFSAMELGAALAGVPDPRHAETDPAAEDPFIAPLACRVDGERRTVTCTPGTRLAALLGTEPFDGLFFCGYAPSAAAVAALEGAGVPIAARAQDVGAVALELPSHPFFITTLFHPQAGTLAGAPLSPLIAAFLAAAREHAAVGAAG
jgi:CTP synthase (UTP-ammonia lyase)